MYSKELKEETINFVNNLCSMLEDDGCLIAVYTSKELRKFICKDGWCGHDIKQFLEVVGTGSFSNIECKINGKVYPEINFLEIED